MMSARRLSRPTTVTVAGVLAVLITAANPAAATPGDLDLTFGTDGKVTTDFSTHYYLGWDEAFAVAVQRDGKIVAAGNSNTGGWDFALARYSTDGSLDPTFGTNGRVTTDFGGWDDANTVAIQGDGKIVAAGRSYLSGSFDFSLARYNTNGSLDPTFSADGRMTTDFAGDTDEVTAMAIQGDGKIVAAGSSNTFPAPDDFALARYNTNGSLDPTFSGDGKVTTDFAGSGDEVAAVAIQRDGRIVAAGSSCCTRSYDFALARFSSDGSLDPTFGADGKLTTDFAGSGDKVTAIAIQGDERIVAAGFANVSGIQFALARFSSDGSLDPTFGADGRVTTVFAGSSGLGNAVAIQGDGKIVAAGCANCSTSPDFALARYKTDGSLDTIFSEDGKVITDFAGDYEVANAVAIQRDGKIIAAGGSVSFGNKDFAVARYTVCRRTSERSSIFCRQ